MSESLDHQAAMPGTSTPAEARATSSPSAPPALPIAGTDTRVMSTVSWIFLGIGIATALLFVQDPSLPRHPHLFLLGTTGLLGSAILRILARLFRDRPVD